MYLDSITLKKFRSCDDTIIKFRSDLTVLVGENNSGKSNILDAIRLLTFPLSGRRDRYAEDEDIRKGTTEGEFSIEGQFAGLSETLKGLLIGAVPDPTQDRAIIGMRYKTKGVGNKRGRPIFWEGKYDTAEPELGSTDLIRHVYLPALRDAQQALGSASTSRITSLLKDFLIEGEEKEFLNHVKRNEKPHRVIQEINNDIGDTLENLTQGVRSQAASLGFASESLLDVARDLRFKLADKGMNLEEIRSSGLGYANLLYMATVVVELAKAKEADLTIFLVEEPEAHLHPQLQMLVLDFLLERANKSIKQDFVAGQPEGQIQVIVTTHSPNLTAWISPKHLVVVRTIQDKAITPHTQKTVSIPIQELKLSPASFNKIGRYLDVTKSAMLFGSHAMLVEGIAEAILLPAIAKHVIFKDDPKAWQRFRGAMLVPIDGVDFKPYVEILLRPYNGTRIVDHLVVITDADPTVPRNRKEYLEELAKSFGSEDNLTIFINQITLEHELFLAGNEKLLKYAYLSIHQKSEKAWKENIEMVREEKRPDAFLDMFTSKRIRKGDFAQQIAMRVKKGAHIFVPKYLNDAIKSIAG